MDRSDDITDGIKDESVDDAYWKLHDQVSGLIFDTNVGADNLEIRKANALIADLNDRVSSIRPTGSEADSGEEK